MIEVKRSLDDIVLYHGSLEELNSRDPDKQYRFAPLTEFISSEYRANTYINGGGFIEDLLSEAREQIIKEIFNKDFDGLVNAKTILYGKYTDSSTMMRIEGTPVIKVRN